MDGQRTEEAVASSTSRPACDNCKIRKTKCDRSDPCSVCVTANLVCKFSSRRPEKRQRVLLSAKYEDALHDVDQKLTDISATLQDLVIRQTKILEPLFPISEQLDFPRSTGANKAFQDFKGHSSFQASVEELERFAAQGSSRSVAGTGLNYNLSSTQAPPEEDLSIGDDVDTKDSIQTSYPELAGRNLPSMEITYRCLRLAHREPQRLFTDVPVLDVEDLEAVCQKIYLSQRSISVFDWVILNASLHHLFTDLDSKFLSELGLSEDQDDAIIENLEANCKAVTKSLRLCMPASIVACMAVALLASYCVRSGQHHTAYRLITFAAGLTLELGLHMSPLDVMNRKNGLFWHIYCMDKFLSFTSGRTATIQHYDISTEYRTHLERHPLVSSGLGYAFIDFAHLAGQIHLQLFSATAREAPNRARIEYATGLIAQLRVQLEALQNLPPSNDPTSKSVLECLSLVAYCYLAVVYQCVSVSDGSVRYSKEAIDNSCAALEVLLELGRRACSRDSSSWFRLLNACLAFTPLTPIVILARYTVTDPLQNHLGLLKSVIDLIGYAGGESPIIQETWMASVRLYQMAESVVARRSGSTENQNAVI